MTIFQGADKVSEKKVLKTKLMKEILDIALKFQGIIGATVGVIATLIVTSLIKNLGKIYTYFRSWEIKFLKMTGTGGVATSLFEEASYCDYSFEMEIINTSESPKALRDIKVRFYSNKNKLLAESIPKDESTRRTSAGTIKTDQIKIINLPSKQMVYFKIIGSMRGKELKNLNKWKKVYLETLDNRGRKVKRIIYKNP